MQYIDLSRAEAVMKTRGVDALVASTERNFTYASGFKPWIPYMGPMLTVIPGKTGLVPAVVISSYLAGGARQWSDINDIRTYKLWMPITSAEEIRRGEAKKPEKLPAYVTVVSALHMLSDILKERGLQDGVIALEKDLLNDPQNRVILAEDNPKAKFVEAEGIFTELQKVKTKDEIKAIRGATDLTIKGIQSVIRGGVLGTTIGELHLRYKRGVYEAATPEQAIQLDALRLGITAGDFQSTLHAPERRVAKGDIIWVDAGVNLFGYYSDMGRTFSVGKPDPLAKKIFSAIKNGFESGLNMIKPGVKFKDIHRVVQDTVIKSGLEWYDRGSMGHQLSIGPGTHQPPPFISAQEETECETNMLFSLENPAYVTGVGGFQIEEELLITPTGYELLTKELPREMIEI